MFYRLLDLAKENTSEARGALMLGLADILVRDIEKRSEAEVEMFGEIASLLYQRSDRNDRIRLSRKVAAESRTPVCLALVIASDQISIALPVLENYGAFSPENLLHLAESLGDEHLQVLARRPDLDHKVSDTLVKRGTRHVHRILAGNRDIRLSNVAMRALVRHAVQDVVLREDMALRPDLTPSICNMLMPHVSRATQKRLQKVIHGVLNQSDLEKIARMRELRFKHGTKIDSLDVKDLLPYAERESITLNELFVLLLQFDRLAHVADLLGHKTKTPPAKAREAVYKGNLEAVVSMALSAAITTDVFSLMAKARCKQLRLSNAQAAEWISAYVKAQRPAEPDRAARRGSGEFAAKRRVRPRREGPRRVNVL